MADKDGKTEKPTAKKLRDARKKGDIVKSQELASALSFALFSLVFMPLGEFVFKNCLRLLKISFQENPNDSAHLTGNLGAVGMKSLLYFVILAAPFLAAGYLFSLLTNLGQVGFIFSTASLKVDLKRINPVTGFKNLFSSQALFSVVKNISKLGLIFYLAYGSTMTVISSVLNIGNFGTEKMLQFMTDFVRQMSLKIALVLFLLGALDYIFQYRSYRKKLKMTKQEIKDEYREMEGDQLVKSQRRAKYRQMISNMVTQVKDSTVVITNPTHLAISIRYDTTKDDAPIVLAKGADHLAQKIREEAKLHQIPIIENKPVARMLYKEVSVGEHVPAELYQAIAEILALVYQMNETKKYKI